MAIIFVSPQKTQHAFLIVFWIFFFLGLIALSTLAILPEIRNQLNVVPAPGEFKMPNVNINFGVVDSDRVKNLEPFNNIQTEFTYVAIDQAGNQSTGTVSAVSKNDAQKILEGTGLKVVSLQEVNTGRQDPFVSYYQSAANRSIIKK